MSSNIALTMKMTTYSVLCNPSHEMLNLKASEPLLVLVLSHLVVSDPLSPFGLKHTRLLCLWDFSGKNAREGCQFLLQGICLTQGSNPCLLCFLHCRS